MYLPPEFWENTISLEVISAVARYVFRGNQNYPRIRIALTVPFRYRLHTRYPRESGCNIPGTLFRLLSSFACRVGCVFVFSKVVVPHVTASYADGPKDQVDDAIPMCTLRNFPSLTEHCIEWAR